LARKFINRQNKKGLDAKEDVSAEDEWAHLGSNVHAETTIEKKIEAADAMDVLDRSITFGDKEEGPKTTLQIVKEEARNAMDAAGNTGQYIRFVNKHIDKQKDEIEKIKQIQEMIHYCSYHSNYCKFNPGKNLCYNFVLFILSIEISGNHFYLIMRCGKCHKYQNDI